MKPNWRDLVDYAIFVRGRAATVVASVAIEHPEMTDAQRARLEQRTVDALSRKPPR